MSTDFVYQGGELALFARAANWKAYFARQLAPHLGARVLEVGAGLGATTRMLCGPGQTEWTCLEPDATMAARLAEGGLPPVCRVVNGTVADLVPGGFDSVVYVDVLEHIENDRAELAAAARLLVPGGRLVVLAPAFAWLYSPFDAAVGHFRRYTRASLLAAAPVGMTVVQVRYLDSAGLILSAANRLLLKAAMPSEAQVLFWDRAVLPLSRLLDPLTGYGFGRSVLAVWVKA